MRSWLNATECPRRGYPFSPIKPFGEGSGNVLNVSRDVDATRRGQPVSFGTTKWLSQNAVMNSRLRLNRFGGKSHSAPDPARVRVATVSRSVKRGAQCATITRPVCVQLRRAAYWVGGICQRVRAALAERSTNRRAIECCASNNGANGVSFAQPVALSCKSRA